MKDSDCLSIIVASVCQQLRERMDADGVTQSSIAVSRSVSPAYVNAVLSGKKGLRAACRIAEQLGLDISIAVTLGDAK